MRLLLLCWCVHQLMLYSTNSLGMAKVFDKRKTRRKKHHLARENVTSRHHLAREDVTSRHHLARENVTSRRDMILKLSKQIRKHIVKELNDKYNAIASSHHILELRAPKSTITRMDQLSENNRRKTPWQIPQRVRKNFISDLPQPKIDILNGILDQAVSQIFKKVIPDNSMKKSKTTNHDETLGDRMGKGMSPLPNVTNARTSSNVSNDAKNASRTGWLKKETLLSYTKQGKGGANRDEPEAKQTKAGANIDGPETKQAKGGANIDEAESKQAKGGANIDGPDSKQAKGGANRDEPKSSNTTITEGVNDTLLSQIDAVTLDPSPSNADKKPKDVVTNMVNAVDTLEIDADTDNSPGNAANDISSLTRDTERNILTNYVNRNPLLNEVDRSGPAEENTWEKDNELKSMPAKDGDEGGSRHMGYFFATNKNTLTNEDEENVKNFDSVFEKKDHDNNMVRKEREPHRLGKHRLETVDENRKHKISFSEKGRFPSEEYGTLFIKDNKVSQQINLYNSDIHLMITVNSSKARLNAMKAIAKVMKELGGMTFKEDIEGIVTKTQFDELMVDADQEEDTSQEEGSKDSRPNLPLNERQIKLTKYKEYSTEGEDEGSHYSTKHIHPRKEKEKEHEGGEEDKDEDAMNYYQKNKAAAQGEITEENDEREQLIPIGPITEVDAKSKAIAIRENERMLGIKSINNMDKDATLQGDANSDVKSSHTSIPSIIHVGINDVNNRKRFEKLFADRVIMAPRLQNRHYVSQSKHSYENGGVARGKKRHLIRIDHLNYINDDGEVFRKLNGVGDKSDERIRSNVDENEDVEVFHKLKVVGDKSDERMRSTVDENEDDEVFRQTKTGGDKSDERIRSTVDENEDDEVFHKLKGVGDKSDERMRSTVDNDDDVGRRIVANKINYPSIAHQLSFFKIARISPQENVINKPITRFHDYDEGDDSHIVGSTKDNMIKYVQSWSARYTPNPMDLTSSHVEVGNQPVNRVTNNAKGWKITSAKGSIDNHGHLDEHIGLTNEDKTVKTNSEEGEVYKGVDVQMVNLKKLIDDIERKKNNESVNTVHSVDGNNNHTEKSKESVNTEHSVVDNNNNNNNNNNNHTKKTFLNGDVIYTRHGIEENKNNTVTSDASLHREGSMPSFVDNTSGNNTSTKRYDPCGGETSCVDAPLTPL